jgi:hypothetical protein
MPLLKSVSMVLDSINRREFLTSTIILWWLSERSKFKDHDVDVRFQREGYATTKISIYVSAPVA